MIDKNTFKRSRLEKDIFNVFTRKSIIIILNIPTKEKTYSQKLSRDTRMTYSYLKFVLEEYRLANLIIFEKKKGNNKKYISLTTKGRKVKESIIKIKKILDGKKSSPSNLQQSPTSSEGKEEVQTKG